jgi:uncharacterized protein with PIN domain
MRLYLDTSALVKLYVDEEGSPLVRSAIERAEIVSTSAITYVEARAAFVRRRHERALKTGDYRRIIRDLDADWGRYLVVEITDSLIRGAAHLAEDHRLKAYSAARNLGYTFARAASFAGKALGLAGHAASPRALPRGAGRRPSSDSPPDCAVPGDLSPILRTAQ